MQTPIGDFGIFYQGIKKLTLPVDTGPAGFLIGTITSNGPWLGPPPNRRGVMTDDVNSE
jgi:hypothetical protein